ncbi:eukaryotic rRNA processing protein EBP2-domain-containing protein [Podospora australis]|uniref:Eukaryotic rRNA processing protein EBP2-domain-containing protein n=1 Tax=Podospora australis TaxID=1536484 RepID=A0AAN7AMK0_9PEZI|nr:eukaryotic rRNA processing protein EBP2-domain-containing protein [Podospora australis]
MAKKGSAKIVAAKAPTPEKAVASAAGPSRKERRKGIQPADRVEKKKVVPAAAAEEEDWEDEDDSEEESDDETGIDYQRLQDINDSDSESGLGSDDDDDEDDEQDTSKLSQLEDGESDSEEEEDSEIDVDDLELDDLDDEDKEELTASTRVRQTINNKEGLLSALRRIALETDPKTVPFKFHMSVVSSKPTEESIPSIDDDLQRELAFANQALEAARQARKLLKKENVPFTRPTDYFAETLRSDDIMQKVKTKLIEDATAKKASAEARKLRDLKKFGKQVQVQKQQERAKEKKATLEKINELKRKRKDGGGAALGAREADDLFDVAVDNELGGYQKSAGNGGRKRSAGDHGPPNAKRQKKDSKYGFGGKKRFAKSGDALSSGDVSGFSAKRMKHGGGAGDGKKFSAMSGPKGSKPRLGKARRQAGRK